MSEEMRARAADSTPGSTTRSSLRAVSPGDRRRHDDVSVRGRRRRDGAAEGVPHRHRKPAKTGQIDEVSAAVHRLAVMLEAGVAPVKAWAYLSEGATMGGLTVVSTVAAVAARGAPIDQAIATASRLCDVRTRQAWSSIAAAWLVAAESGAPLAGCLRDVSRALLELGDVQRSIDVALAAPIATARLMTLLPVVGLAFGAVLGFNTLATLFTTGPGLVCAAAGIVLLLVSRSWNVLLVRAALPRSIAAGMAVELMAIAMAGGASVGRARHTTTTALTTYDIAEPGDEGQVDAVIELARRAGVPAAELLRAEGAHARREALSSSQKRAAGLSVRLMLPLGLCVLPAFMLLGVAPLLLSVVTSTFTSL
ncbi:MAG: Integral rane protein [Subtercola sp.]|nr:Integral rane protein [Subtercola sp.]